jgi:phenylacetate-CoA ligase
VSERPVGGLSSRLRESTYFAFHAVTGSALGRVYRGFLAEDAARSAHLAVPERLGDLLRHAAHAVPYYADRLGGMDEEIARDPVAALRSLPVLTKEDVRENFDRLCSTDLAGRSTYEQTSGGSSGEPLRLIQDRHFRSYDQAIQLLISSWTGWRPGEPELMILGSDRDIRESTLGPRAEAANRLLRRSYVNAFRMSPEAMRACLRLLNQKPPRLIRAYAQSIYDLATFARQEGIDVAPQQAILTTAGMLYPFMRERIESVFDCRVQDQYGSREVSGIAAGCGEGQGLHVLPWMCFVEVVDEEGQNVESGADGRLLVTSLCNYAMPLIRYEIGDRAALLADDASACPCGRGGQRLVHLSGRIIDTFKASDGSLVNGEYFTHLLYFRDAIERFQVVQTERQRVLFRLVLRGELSDDEKAEITAGTRETMGPECQVDFETVGEIEPSPSGKYRYTISECR